MPRKKKSESATREGSAPRQPVRKRELSSEQLQRRNALIEEYTDYAEQVVVRIMRSMRLPPVSKDDFLSAGFLGLIEAAGRYENARGHEFRAYAYMRIRGAIIDYIRTSCELTGYAYRRFKAIEAAQELREAELEGRATSSQSHPQQAHSPTTYLEKIAVAFKLSTQTEEEEVDPEKQDQQNPEYFLQNKQRIEKIRGIVATLPEKERTIIEQYYFCDRKLVEVAGQFAGLSKSWVSRLHDRALEMLREKMLEAISDIAA
jgi:RNA polymerase sigma factor for flagellar operon FliA